jgi:F-type H+-transporting ATPase subunit b
MGSSAHLIPLVLLPVAMIAGILLILRHFLIRNVTQVTSHLDKMEEDFSRRQSEASKILEKARTDADQLVAKAQKEAKRTVEKAVKEATVESEEIVKNARRQSEEIVDEANRTKEFLLSEMNTKIREGAVEIAGDLVLRVLPERIRRDAHARRIAELLNGGLAGFEGVHPREGAEVRIVSAYELADDQRAAIENQLKEKLGVGIGVRVDTDPSLVAGVIVGVGDLVVDSTLKYSIEEAARDVRRSTG